MACCSPSRRNWCKNMNIQDAYETKLGETDKRTMEIHAIRFSDVSFSKMMEEAGVTPLLFEELLPSMDLVIWRMRPRVSMVTEEDLRRTVFETFDFTIKENRPGATIHECESKPPAA